MVKMLEAKLALEEARTAKVVAGKAELNAIAADAAASRPALLPALLRSLAMAEAELSLSEMRVTALREQLLAAKGCEKLIAGKAKLLGLALDRKSGEEDALDATLAMMGKRFPQA
jgi:hypothetical protein